MSSQPRFVSSRSLVHQYEGASFPVYHLDLYRLGGPEELLELGYEELFDGADVCAVEWAERAEGLLPRGRVDICFAQEKILA